ncbi:MAG: flagellar basal-body rod protein FlgF [Thioalkalispiraceae bacterium]|jgi:flagellar basal-body rod protein FlgF
MDRMLYISMAGAKQTMLAQAATSNNLANVSTTGFKADFNTFRSQHVIGEGLPTRAYAMDERPGVDMSSGTLIRTGRELDVAVHGEGWLSVLSPDGTEAYTRAGHLNVTATGQLITDDGLPVMGDNGPIAIPPAEKIEIGGDGTITIQGQGQAANTLTQVERIKLVKPDVNNLYKGNDGLFHTRDGIPAVADADVKVVSKTLEGSNVNAVGEMVKMMTLQRNFELQVKMMDTAKQNSEQTAQLLKLA